MTINDNSVQNTIIIGSGPAGYTAAIYAARAALKPIVFEGIDFGGSLMTTTMIENFPGFPQGIQGPELMTQMREQAKNFGAKFITDDVISVNLTETIKTVATAEKQFQTKTVILATGATPRYLDIPGEKEFLGKGVSTCATCDGFFFQNQDIAVVGGGDSAMEEAIFLTKFAKTVTIIHRSENFRASKIMLERAKNNPKINFITNTIVTKIIGNDRVSKLALLNTVTNTKSDLSATGIFVVIGHIPKSELVSGILKLKDTGHVEVAPFSTQTSISGVFAAGDLVDTTYRQAITAAGSGCAAAIEVERWLAKNYE